MENNKLKFCDGIRLLIRWITRIRVLGETVISLLLFLLVACSSPVELAPDVSNLYTFIEIPLGSFDMGAPASEQGTQSDERPVHTVTFDYDFEIMTTEVTQALWVEVMGVNPSCLCNPENPVEMVSWSACQGFIIEMNVLDPSYFYRLPTEAEWEFCCRAGSTTRFYWGEDSNEDEVHDYAWNNRNSGYVAHAVAQKLPNAWGLYDMSGNVCEWCEDGYHVSYTGAPDNGSSWDVPFSSTRIIRGGGWLNLPKHCRSANRQYSTIGYCSSSLGFRLVRTKR